MTARSFLTFRHRYYSTYRINLILLYSNLNNKTHTTQYYDAINEYRYETDVIGQDYIN